MNLIEGYAELVDDFNKLSQKCDELKAKIKDKTDELNREIQTIKEECVGFEEDPVFLLSINEYQKEYAAAIPQIKCHWWLRSPSDNPNGAKLVRADGSICNYGYDITNNLGVRPAFKYEGYSNKTFHYHSKFCFRGITWVVIDPIEKLAIAEMPISFRKFDDTSNKYQNSDIREWLSQWFEEHRIQGV